MPQYCRRLHQPFEQRSKSIKACDHYAGDACRHFCHCIRHEAQHPTITACQRTTLTQVKRQLLDEQGVALGLFDQKHQEIIANGVAERLRRQHPDGVR